MPCLTVLRHYLTSFKMQIAKVPNFLRFIPELYHEDTPISDWAIENSLRQIPVNLVRYRHNPKTGDLESNANFYRWNDGSMTMQVGEEHYEIQVKPQIPPPNKAYMSDRDANRYIAAAQEGMQQLLTVAHVTEEWSVRPDRQRVEEDTERLREQMGLASGGAREGELIITTTQDPELQKRQAELAEKERIRAQRKRENAQLRVEAGPGGFRKGNSSSMGLGDLESGRRAASGRKRGAGGAAKRSRARNDDYDSDDEGQYGQDAYDKHDGFIASSGDEVSEGDDDDILDDGDVEFERERPHAKRPRTEESSNDEADADADGEPDDDAPTTAGDHSRRRVRRVVSDDDDDE